MGQWICGNCGAKERGVENGRCPNCMSTIMAYSPTRKEIAAECRQIRQGWDRSTERNRRVGWGGDFEIPRFTGDIE